MLFTGDINVSAAELKPNERHDRGLALLLNMMQPDCNASCKCVRQGLNQHSVTC